MNYVHTKPSTSLKFSPIEKVTNLSPSDFKENFLKPLKPAVFTDLMDKWPAKGKWSLEFFKNEYGDLMVPVYSSTKSKNGKGYMQPDQKIPFREYLESIEKGQTNYRMFLFNLMSNLPDLKDDIIVPTQLMDGFIKSFAYMFFGSKGSKVKLHYDVDLSHVFLNQFHGVKRCVLFSPENSPFLYQHPFTVASYIDVDNPDYEKFPALKHVKGYEVFLQPGETLYIPSGFWHYIEYAETSFSINNRANEKFSKRLKGGYNIAKNFVVDRAMNRILKERWRDMKTGMAEKNANQVLNEKGLLI